MSFLVTINESIISKPDHRLKIGLSSVDMKLDYMSTSICMLQLTDLQVSFNDEWIISESDGAVTPTTTPIATSR